MHIFRDHEISEVHFQSIIKPIAEFCVEASIFRPGLVKLLKTLHKLRATGKLDAVVMYTFQDEYLGRKNDFGEYYNSHGQKVHIPRVLDYCFGYLATGIVEPFFDTRITRDIHREALGLKETDSFGQKSVDLVFKKLQLHPSNDLRGVIFIDDCYLNTQFSRKYQLGPLTGVYIKDYRFTLSDINTLIASFKKLYKTLLKQYISKHMFDEFMVNVSQQKLDNFGYSIECTPKNAQFSYNSNDLSVLTTLINNYYLTNF